MHCPKRSRLHTVNITGYPNCPTNVKESLQYGIRRNVERFGVDTRSQTDRHDLYLTSSVWGLESMLSQYSDWVTGWIVRVMRGSSVSTVTGSVVGQPELDRKSYAG
jgi:hypothetical protein